MCDRHTKIGQTNCCCEGDTLFSNERNNDGLGRLEEGRLLANIKIEVDRTVEVDKFQHLILSKNSPSTICLSI